MENHEEVLESSSDEEENVKLVGAETQKLILQIEASPFQYDKHIELIAALRKSADLDQLRAAREKMSSIFPLTEELWIEWFEDELPLAVLQEQKQYIITKFEYAVKDYASVKVWHEYCQYMMNNIDSPADIERARNVFEQAITAVGLHVTEGASIWDGYREFEIAILDSYQQLQDSDDTVNMECKVDAQIERIASIYKRQLSLPLLGVAALMESFENWYSQPVPDDINQTFERSQKKVTLLLEYEEKLRTTEGSNLSEYLAYVDYEINGGDPARIQSIFERAIKDNCLEYDLWEKYTNYMDFQLKIPNLSVGVHKRAVRNCPWLSKFWQNYLKALERNSADPELYLDAFNQSLKGGFTDGESYLQLWITRCDYHRRSITNWSSEEDKIEVLRNSFESGMTYMNHYFGVEGDKYSLLLREWAFVEAEYCKNVKKSKKLWDAVLKKHSHDPTMWLEYIDFLILFTEVLTVRRAFQRAVQINMEQPEIICDAFMKFERRYGSLRDVDDTQQKINVQIKQHKERCMKISTKDDSGNQRRKRKNKFEVTGEYENKKKKKNSEKERKTVKSDFEIEKKKQKVEEESEHSDLNPSSDITLANHSEIQKSSETKITVECEKISAQSIILDEAATSISSLETEKVTEDEMASICSNQLPPQEDMVINDKTIDSCDKDNLNTETEENCRDVDNVDKDKSVFLSNLLFSVEEIHLRDMFRTCGEINQIHVVTNKVGKSKGYAYMEFKERESVEAALKLDRESLLDRPVFVSPCIDTKENPTQFKFPTSLDKHTLYVSNLPFELGTEEVKQHFAQAGEIKQVRLVTNRSGKSKGYAYVEYESEVIAATAILKFDKQILNGRPINVALSNPPTRKQNQQQKRVQEQPAQLLNSRKQDFPGSRGRSKTQISLVPRALLTTKPKEKQLSSDVPPATESTTATTTVSESSIVQATPMNNSDFRKFLLK